MTTTGTPSPRKGEVWEVDLDPTVGHEMRKRRRVVVVSVDGLVKLGLRIVVPLTTWQPSFAGKPWLVRIEPQPPTVTKEVAADCFQLRCIAVERFRNRMGRLTPADEARIIDGIALCLDIELTDEDEGET